MAQHESTSPIHPAARVCFERQSFSLATILHVTECVVGGDPTVIRSIAQNAVAVKHIVPWPEGNDGTSDRTSVHLLSCGAPLRIGALRRIRASAEAAIVHAEFSWAALFARVLPGSTADYPPNAFAFQGRSGWIRRMLFWVDERMLAHITRAFAVGSAEELPGAKDLSKSVPTFVVSNASSSKGMINTSRVQSRSCNTIVGRNVPKDDPILVAPISSVASRGRKHDRQSDWIGYGYDRRSRKIDDNNVILTDWLISVELLEQRVSADLNVPTARCEGFQTSGLDDLTPDVPILVRHVQSRPGYGVPKYKSVNKAPTLIDTYCFAGKHDTSTMAVQRRVGEITNETRQVNAVLATCKAVS